MSEQPYIELIETNGPLREWYPDLEIIAYVHAWNMVPPGLPLNHRLYYWDGEKGWAYLTLAGYNLYRANEGLLAPTMAAYRERLAAWSKVAVEVLVGEWPCVQGQPAREVQHG